MPSPLKGYVQVTFPVEVTDDGEIAKLGRVLEARL